MITTHLQPHQQRALERALENNIILAHGMGSGKTLSALAIADALGKPTTALVPAPTVENFKREIAKHKKGGPPVNVISLPTAVSRDLSIPKGNTVILDEAHAFRNPSQRSSYIRQALKRAGRVVALTGTPAYNKSEDWIPLVNLVSGKKTIESLDPYIKERQIPLSFWERLQGVKPGVVAELTRRRQLREQVSPYVDIFDEKLEMPDRVDKDVMVPLSKEQIRLYRAIQDRLPYSLVYKLKNNLPPSKAESKNLNAFLAGIRQVSNTTQAFEKDELPKEKLEEDSPKLKVAVEDILKQLKKNPKARTFVYSNYLDAGVTPMSRLLKAHKIKHAIFSGSLSPKEREQIINDYNTGKLPVLLGTGAASEGLNLKQTNLVEILEPHFNNARIEQAIARGIRYKSHEGLPPDQRKVQVNRYYGTLDNDRSWWDKLWGNDAETSVDLYLKSRSEEKDRLINDIKETLKG